MKWIKSNVPIKEETKKVLAYFKNGKMEVVYSSCFVKLNTVEMMMGTNFAEFHGITHYMYLPENPNKSNIERC